MTITAFPLIALPLFSESFDLILATKQSAYLRNEYCRGKPFTFPRRCMELFFILRRLWWLEGKLSDYRQNGRECQIVPGVPMRVLSLCISLGLHISKLLIVWKKKLYFFTAHACFPLFAAKYNRYMFSAMNKAPIARSWTAWRQCQSPDSQRITSLNTFYFFNVIFYLWTLIGIMAYILLFKLNKTIIQL